MHRNRMFSAFFNRAVRRASSPSSLQFPDGGPYVKNSHELEVKGFTVLKDLFSAGEVDKMKSDFEMGALVKSQAMMEQTEKLERIWMENDEETRSVYWKGEDEGGGKSLIQRKSDNLDGVSPSSRVEMKFSLQAQDPVNGNNLCNERFGTNAINRLKIFKWFFSVQDPRLNPRHENSS